MTTETTLTFRIGDRVRLSRDVDRYPLNIYRHDTHGTVVAFEPDIGWIVHLDRHFPELEEWSNCLHIGEYDEDALTDAGQDNICDRAGDNALDSMCAEVQRSISFASGDGAGHIFDGAPSGRAFRAALADAARWYLALEFRSTGRKGG